MLTAALSLPLAMFYSPFKKRRPTMFRALFRLDTTCVEEQSIDMTDMRQYIDIKKADTKQAFRIQMHCP